MEEINMPNVHSYKPKNCTQGCCLCFSYTPPLIIILLIVGLTVGLDAYFIHLCLYNTGWRVGVSIIFMIIGTAASAFLLWTFLCVVTTAAGYVPSIPWKYPPTYVGDRSDLAPTEAANANSEEEGLNPFSVRQLDRRNKLRFCGSCSQFKPDDAYHCSMCKRCTYNFDHHCPAINNCVGRDNYKMFVLFLVYVGVVGLFNGALMLIGLFAIDKSDWNFLWAFLPIFMLVLAVVVGAFGLVHARWMYNGQSTMSRHIAEVTHRSPSQFGGEEWERRRGAHWDAVLGTDRRWWRIILPLPPVRRPAV